MSGPIADLSYRNYDGPLEKPLYRWWGIAKMMMRLGSKKKMFWVWSSMSALPYLLLATVFYFADTLSAQLPPTGSQIPQFFRAIVWKDQFLTAFNWSQIWLLIITLLIGAGAIAGDNRANALLVYLSKPCTKSDYLLGKWFGMFLPLLAVVGAPMLLFYGYCFLSYRQYGFVSQDPYLFFKLLAVMPIPAAIHTSLILGVSSVTNQGRVAGGIYAGIYFLTSFVAIAAEGIRGVNYVSGGESPVLVNLSYASVTGLQQGLTKAVLGTSGSPPFGVPSPVPMPPAPPLFLFSMLAIGICAVSLLIAWRRIRAVEVIGG